MKKENHGKLDKLHFYLEAYTRGYNDCSRFVEETVGDDAVKSAVHFRDLSADLGDAACVLYLLCEYLWGTCPDRRDRNAYISAMAWAEKHLSPGRIDHVRVSKSLDGHTLLGDALKPDFDPKGAIYAQLNRRRTIA